MPVFDIELDDGRTITLESDTEPTESDILSALSSYQPEAPQPEPALSDLQATIPTTFPRSDEELQSRTFDPNAGLPSGIPFSELLPKQFGPRELMRSMAAFRPGIGLPNYPQPSEDALKAAEESKAMQLAAGATVGTGELIAGIAQFLTSPQGIAEAGIATTPLAPVVAAKWAKDMVEGGLIESGEAYDAYKRGDMQEFAKHVAVGAGLLAGGGGIVKGGVAKAGALAEGYIPRGTGIETARPERMVQDASEIPSPAIIPELEVRPRVGEEALRQPGEVAREEVGGPQADVGRIEVPEAPTPEVISQQTGFTYDAGMEQVTPEAWHFTDKRPGSPTESLSVAVAKGSTPEQVQAAIDAKAKSGFTEPVIPEGEPAPADKFLNLPSNAPPGGPAPVSGKISGDTPLPAAAPETKPADTPAAEIFGMGGATPAELNPPTPFVTSNKNAVVDAERKARGLPPMMALERQSNPSAWDAAMKIVDERPEAQDALITELADNPRAVTPTENAMLLQRRIDLRNEYEKSLVRWKQAFEDNDLVRAAEESEAVSLWSRKLADLESVTKATGAESGRSLQARKMMAREDYSLAMMELRARQAKGRDLTSEERMEVIRAHERIAELESKLEALETTRESKEVEAQTKAEFTRTAREAPGEKKSKDFDLDREENLLGSIRLKAEKGETQQITPLVQQLARLFWRQGIREREPMIDALHSALKTILPDFTREQTQRAFSGYGNFTPLTKAEIDVGLRDLRGQTQQVLKLEALEARKPLEKTGQERRVPSDEERRLIKQVNELKRKYGVVVTDPATQLRSALQSRKTYYEHRIADLKHEIQTRERIVKTKSPSPTDAQLEAMRAEYEQLRREHAEIFTNPELTLEQRLELASKSADRQIAELERQLRTGEIFPGSKAPKLTSPELEAKRARIEALKLEREFSREAIQPKPERSPEAIALKALKTRLKNQAADLLERKAKGDFAKRERKPVPRDTEAARLEAQRDIAKEEFELAREQDEWNRSSLFQKTKRTGIGLYDAARAIMTTGEFSFILRQGKLVALTRPDITVRALPDTFRALVGSEAKVRELENRTLNDPMVAVARQDKLHLDEPGAKLSRQDELFMGRLVGKIPVVKNFNNAARVFLNKIRFDMWKAMRKSMTKSGTPTPGEGRQIAMAVNEMTGRGSLGKAGEPAAVFLGRVFFSPRYLASRVQLAAGHSMWGGTARSRAAIAKVYARALVGMGLYYTGLKMLFSDDKDKKKGEVETDPRSADFGKVRIGNTRLDPLSGLAQVTTFGARTATGETKTPKGIQAIRGEKLKFGSDKWTDVAARFGRSKLHPVPASIANLFDGTDLSGTKATLATEAGGMAAPISYVDIYKALREQDVDDATALALLAFLGEGLQTYKPRK